MILCKICDLHNYLGVHAGLEKVEHFLMHTCVEELPFGKTYLDGARLYVDRSIVSLKNQVDQLVEVHRNYFDVHVPLDGAERIGWKSFSDLKNEVEAYDTEKDIAFYRDAPHSFVDVCPGECLVVFPEDGHAPIIGNGELDKLVFKIRL